MIGLVDYDAGNVRSVANALHNLEVEFVLTSDPVSLAAADGLILPGVGAAPGAMESLDRRNLTQMLRGYKKPFLGICLGMELLLTHSDEGNIGCLGVLPGTIKRFDARAEKVPHMGWNQVEITRPNPLTKNLPDNANFYFAHSYYAPVDDSTTAVTSCGMLFASMVNHENFYGVQFHPEKSGPDGLTLLHNFNLLCTSSRQ